jgi:hypothetical protein
MLFATRSLASIGVGMLLPAGAAAQVPDRDAAASLAALFDAMGGRPAWAGVQALDVQAVHHLAGEAASFDNRIRIDFMRPRLRIESWLLGLNRVRVVEGASGWRRRGDEPVVALTEAEVASETEWWASHVYRTIARLARGDAALSVTLSGDGRLVVSESGKTLNWLRLDRRGEPIAFGTRETAPERGTIFGPLVAHGALKFPGFSVSDQGRWRAIPRRFEALAELPASLFAPPA